MPDGSGSAARATIAAHQQGGLGRAGIRLAREEPRAATGQWDFATASHVRNRSVASLVVGHASNDHQGIC